jgi:hypothetical protein
MHPEGSHPTAIRHKSVSAQRRTSGQDPHRPTQMIDYTRGLDGVRSSREPDALPVPRWSGAATAMACLVAAVVAEALVLAYGGVVHVSRLADGWPPYPWAPRWLGVYFVSLTALDPLAAWLLLGRRRADLDRAVFVLVTDVLANGYACLTPPGPVRRGTRSSPGWPAGRTASCGGLGRVTGAAARGGCRRRSPWTVPAGRADHGGHR